MPSRSTSSGSDARPVIGTGRVCATSAISAPSVTTISTPSRSAASSDRVGEGAPAEVGLDPAEQHQVALGGRRTRDRQQRVRGPVDLARLALGQPDRRPVDLEVVELLGVDPRDRPPGRARPRPPRGPCSRRWRRRSSRRTRRPASGERSSGGSPSQRIGSTIASLSRSSAERRAGRGRPAPRVTIEAWKPQSLRRPTTSARRGSPTCARAAGSRAASVPAEGPADLDERPARTCRSSSATAPARSPPGCSARPTASALRFESGDAVRVRGRVERFRGEMVAELDDVERLEPGSYDPAEFLPAAYRSVEELEGFLEHLAREIHDPALLRPCRAAPAGRPGRRRLPPRPMHPRRPPRLPRRPARAHRLGRHAGRRALPAASAARLRPADGRGAPPRRRQGARVHLRGRVRAERRGQDARPPGDRRRSSSPALRRTSPAERRLPLLNCVLSHHGPDGAPGRGAASTRRRPWPSTG